MNKMAIAELVAAVAARVSLVREVAYPSHRRVDCHNPRRAEELGKEEVESHASNVVPIFLHERELLLMKEVNHCKWVMYLDLYKAAGQTRTNRQKL